MQDFVDKLKDNPSFIAFKEYIFEEVEKISNVEGLSKLSDKRAGEESKLRERTKIKVMEIFSLFVDFKEKTSPTVEQINDAKDKNLL